MLRPVHMIPLAFVAACAGHPAPAPALPFDLRPAMDSIRADTAAIRIALDQKPLAQAVSPAYRLAHVELGPGYDAPDEFRRLEQELRATSAQLLAALEREHGNEASLQFERLLRRCDACHAVYRPSGVVGR